MQNHTTIEQQKIILTKKVYVDCLIDIYSVRRKEKCYDTSAYETFYMDFIFPSLIDRKAGALGYDWNLFLKVFSESEIKQKRKKFKN